MTGWRWLIVIGWTVGLWALPAAAQNQPASGGQSVPAMVAGDVYARAETALDAGDYPRAALDYSLFLLLNPTAAPAYYARGFSYFQMGDFARAQDDLTRALRYTAPNPEFTARVYNLRALTYLRQEDVEAALADLQAGIDAAPDFPAPYLTRADLLAALGRYEEALADYDRVIALDDAAARAFAGRAAVQQQLGRLEAALADYDRLVELAPNSPEALFRRASVRMGLEQYQAAQDDLSRAIQLAPNTPALYLSRAHVRGRLGDPNGQAADYLEWTRLIGEQPVDEKPLAPGESRLVQLSEGAVYRFPFEVAAGQVIQLMATARPGSTTDPLLILLDPAGAPVASDDDGGGELNAQIAEYTILQDGTYTAVVSHAGGSPNGPVRVLLRVLR